MLQSLSIQDVVLIERLDISWATGLCVLTGETGAGKSILLDALGLALGERSQGSLVRPGSERAVVTAEFAMEPNRGLKDALEEQAIAWEETLILKRILNADGRSRALINDQPVSIGFLRAIGEQLVEVHGQFDQLLEPASHRQTLDTYGGLEELRAAVKAAYQGWQEAERAFTAAQQQIGHYQERQEQLMAAIQDLQGLQLQAGEEQRLMDERAYLSQHHKLSEASHTALQQLSGERGAEGMLAGAYRTLSRVADLGRFNEMLDILDRTQIECHEVVTGLKTMVEELSDSARRLEEIEERLFKLRAAARKHHCAVDDLAALFCRCQEELQDLEEKPQHLGALEQQLQVARAAYEHSAQALRRARSVAAADLAEYVMQELPSLKLEMAEFTICIGELSSGQWNAEGIDRIEFQIRTNPGMPFGGLREIASGGERARFMLALKTVLARTRQVPTLIFDEIDIGLGGAVAQAVGERLSRLGEHIQVLAITHSPQVASMAAHHWRVQKLQTDKGITVEVVPLNLQERREEVARMLSGRIITAEARAAAEQLLQRRTG